MTKIEKIIFTGFIFLLSLVPLLWFHGNQILLGYDNVYPLNPGAFLLNRIFSWTSTVPFGMDQSGVQGSLIVHLIDSLPLFLGFSVQSAQKIVFSFWFFLILASAYVLIVKLEKAKLVDAPYLRYIFPVLYAFNFYILQAWWIAERTKFSLVVAAPLILSIILPMIKTQLSFSKVIKNSIICAFVLTILNGGGWAGLSLYGGLLLALFVFYAFYLVNSGLANKKNIALMSLFYLLFGVWFIFLNAYTFLPFLLITFKDYGSQITISGGLSGVVDWARYLSENTSIVNLLRLQGIPDWYNNAQHPYSSFYLNNIVLIASSFIFGLFAILSIFEKKQGNKLSVFFFFFLFLVSLVFTAGIHKPLGFIPEFLIRNLPGFAIFRSLIFKFGYVYWLAASFLIGITIARIIESLSSGIKNSKIAAGSRVFLLLTFIVLILAYHFPYFTGDIFRLDKTKISSRVEIPSYISDFSKWWSQEGREDKILLLPRLNGDWLFEQYKWSYLSLFPVLGNFANTGVVENNDTLAPGESMLVNGLYNAINEGNYVEMDSLTSMLGIKYFLIRRDFYYNIPDQRTDNPYLLGEKLTSNKNIIKIRSFGEWDVYRYGAEKPAIFVKNNGIMSVGGNLYLPEIEKNPLFLDEKPYIKASNTFSDSIVYLNCLSCEAERQTIQAEFPKPKIVIDSPLYNFVELRQKLAIPKNEFIDQKISRLLGESLSMIGQLNEVMIQNKGEYYVNEVRVRLEEIVESIGRQYKNVVTGASNPYSLSVIVSQYLSSEAKMVADIRVYTSRKNDLINFEKILYSLYSVGDKYKNFYEGRDITTKKMYKFDLLSSGDYSLKIDKSTFGTLLSSDYEKISVNVDGKEASINSQPDGKYLDFGRIKMEKGTHMLRINLSSQQNILKNPIEQRLAGTNCYSSYVENFSPLKTYDLRFSVKNNFDSNFFYFIDDGELFSPYLVYYFPVQRNQIEPHRVIVSIDKIPINQWSNKFRVSFCSPSLTKEIYEESISDLSIVEIVNPKIILRKEENKVFVNNPVVNFSKENQTHYRVNVKNATGSYYLVFAQRYSPNWRSSIGFHFVGNGYNNVWLIEKTGDYSIELTYEPQRYVLFGAIISLLSLVAGLFVVKAIKTND